MGTCWDVAQAFTRIAQDLAAQDGGHATSARVTELAHATYGGDLAAVWRCSDAGPRLDSATDALAGKRLNHIVTDTRQGPVVTALHERTTVIVSDLWDEPRWPDYRQRLLREQLPIRAVAAFCLSGTDGDLGALVLYSAEPGYPYPTTPARPPCSPRTPRSHCKPRAPPTLCTTCAKHCPQTGASGWPSAS